MIELKRKDGKVIWIAPEHVVSVQPSLEGEGLTTVFFDSGTTITVANSVNEVLTFIDKELRHG